MTEQLNILDAIERAKARRDLGIERVARKSGDEWQSMALDRLRMYLRMWDQPFLAEDFITWALENGFRAPHDKRAYGAVMQTAARRMLIVKVGFKAATTSNMSPKVLWKRGF